ncbi:MAG: FAD-dependent oxidoreductase [Bryobacteraceae bacterium]
MALFKDVKKPALKVVQAGGAQISALRPRYIEKTPPCIGQCPGGTDIRGWLTTIAQAEAYGRTYEQAYELAWKKIVDRNPFPAVCGRVCPHPCEAGCNRNVKEGAVAINALERFVGDFGIDKGWKLEKMTQDRREQKVAVAGAGPAGLSCAYQLARRGYAVTVFEAFSKPGGMLRYGIPEYRLPRAVLDAEIGRIVELGVELRCGARVNASELRKEFDAVFVGVGAHKGLKLRVPGEDAPNVFTGTEFLNHVNSGESVAVGDRVIVIGGGDTAIDAARMSKRLGADVTILYRRTRAEMPAIAPEIEGALEEGVKIEFLAAPVEVLRNHGAAVGIRAIRMQLGEPDASGRPRPVPQPGSEFELAATAVIAAISQEPEDGWLKADDFGRTEEDGIFAGGDDVGLGLVSIAIGQGRFAAEAIDARFRGVKIEKPAMPPVVKPDRMKPAWYKESPARSARKSARAVISK